MTMLLRFRDLKERGIVTSWTMLKLRVKRDGFPPGRMIGPQSRAWTEAEVDRWIETRPTKGPAARGDAKRRQAAKAAKNPTEAHPE